MYPTTNILHRVFKVRVIVGTGNEMRVLSGGTMFVIDVDYRQYLVTARHVAMHINSAVQVQVWRNGSWNSIPVRIVGHGEGDVDVSVLDANISLVPAESRFHLPTGSEGIILGQETMFLGFPNGYEVSKTLLLHSGFPMPLVKYARLAAMPQRDFPMWIDGHNNQGFSGGPLCFIRNGETDVRVAGVVVAYQYITRPVIYPDGSETEFLYQENMGLGLAWDIEHCTEIIDRNPIGLELR